MKIVSVVIPAYNREKYIAAAIDSVLNQQLPKGWKLEVIVVDDGSADETKKIARGYGNKIIFKTISHSGKPATPRNIALNLATGGLIAFQDSDDLWTDNKLATQISLFDDAGVVMSFGNAEAMTADGKLTGQKVIKPAQLKDGESFSTLLRHNVISTLTVMVRRSALETVGHFNEANGLRAVEDYELWLRLVAQFPKGIKHTTKTLAYYRSHDQNISNTNDLIAIERLLNVYNSVWETRLSDSQRQKLELALTTMHTNWGRLQAELHLEQKPTVSVVMSVYNAEAHLPETIKSVLAQTYQDFEFIIIDDGSTDKSVAIINDITDKRLRLIRQRNHGLVYSLNKGIQLARGQYIARQDADDISLPERFAKEVALLNKNSRLGLVGTFFTYVDEATKEPGLTICMPTKSLDVKRALYITNPIGHGTAMIRRAVFNDMATYTDTYGPTEDFELWRRIAEHWEMAIIPESLYNYLLNKTSISHTKGQEQHANTDKIRDEQWAKPFLFKSTRDIIQDGYFYKNLKSPFASLIYDQYAAHQIDIAKALFDRGALKNALRTAYGAARLKPRALPLFIKPALRGTMRRLRIWR